MKVLPNPDLRHREYFCQTLPRPSKASKTSNSSSFFRKNARGKFKFGPKDVRTKKSRSPFFSLPLLLTSLFRTSSFFLPFPSSSSLRSSSSSSQSLDQDLQVQDSCDVLFLCFVLCFFPFKQLSFFLFATLTPSSSSFHIFVHFFSFLQFSLQFSAVYVFFNSFNSVLFFQFKLPLCLPHPSEKDG